MTEFTFDKHITDMVDDYKKVFVLNLLSTEKYDEEKLSDRAINLIKRRTQTDTIGHLSYDFHKYTANDNFDTPIFELMEWLKKNVYKEHGFFSTSASDPTQVNVQKGIIRTNCLDCLDRTNIVQAEICCALIRHFLDHLKQAELSLGSKISPHSGFGGPQEYAYISDAVRQMWNQNGDKLSNQYAGTNSNLSGVIEHGRQGIAGKLGQMFTGVQRYIVNNWNDAEKQ